MKPDLSKYPDSSLKSYLSMMLLTTDANLSGAYKQLCQTIGINYHHSTMYEYLKLIHEPPRVLREYCNRMSVGFVLSQFDINVKQANKQHLDTVAQSLT